MSDEIVKGVISKLLSLKGKSQQLTGGMTLEEMEHICSKVRDIFLEQPVLLELRPPVVVCGDTHGQFHDLLRLFDVSGYPPRTNYLFLGDYVDRGYQSLETVCLLFCYKILYPRNFFMLRGNHESSAINRLYGFYDDCCQQYNIGVWRMFSDVFNCLPIAAVVNNKLFCVHGGISPDLESLDQIREIRRPVEIPDEGLLCDLLWADPNPDVETWEENERGTSYCFGAAIAEDFLARFGFNMICRAHQAVTNGYEFPFFPAKSVLTCFSAPNYCYEFDNKAAMLHVSETLFCTFYVIDPVKYEDRPIAGHRPGTPPRSLGMDDDDDEMDFMAGEEAEED